MLESIVINFSIFEICLEKKDLKQEEKQNIKRLTFSSLNFLNNISISIENFKKNNPKNKSIKFFENTQKKACYHLVSFTQKINKTQKNEQNFIKGLMQFSENFTKDKKI